MLSYDHCLERATECAAEADLVKVGRNRLRYVMLAAEWMARADELRTSTEAEPLAA